jgi:hypothetical protein
VSTPRKYYDPVAKANYQREYRKLPERHVCDCGRPAKLYRSTHWVCARCAGLQTQKAFDWIHRTTVGTPDEGGMCDYALCLPGGMAL